MKENTNKVIAFNSIVLYCKMAINTICGLFATRFALRALGVVDYGLYAVLGGIISFIAIFNTIMILTSNRFIAVAIGKGDIDGVNKQFNVNLTVHATIALFALIIAYPIGNWYIPRFVNYDGDLSNAMMVYLISVMGSIVSFLGVPYNGLLMAKEKFIVFSLVDVIAHILRLVLSLLLVFYFENKLFVYTMFMALLPAMSTATYIIYCVTHYREIVRIRLVYDKQMYRQVFGFSSWVTVGAFASIGRSQGAALIVNSFFNTIMNSALGVSSSINAFISHFSQAIKQPMAPQITKSFSSGDVKRTDELLVMSTKYTFQLTFVVSSILLAAPDWIIKVWLGTVPPYASIFLVLLIVDNLVQSLNSGVGILIFASGKISLYQILTSILNLLAIALGFILLRQGLPAFYLLVGYITMSAITFFTIQFVLHHVLKYDNKKLWINSYCPSLFVTALCVPAIFAPVPVHPLLKIAIVFVYCCIIEFYIGLTKIERIKIKSIIQNFIRRFK